MAYRGIAITIIHCAIVLSLAGKYALDRERLPRVWVKTAPYDPTLPIRGRYVSLRLQVDCATDVYPSGWISARLEVKNNRLVALPVASGAGIMISGARGLPWTLTEPVAFFIPEHIEDPSLRPSDEELWVEATVPKSGPPRPLRLGVKKNGVLTPLDLR